MLNQSRLSRTIKSSKISKRGFQIQNPSLLSSNTIISSKTLTNLQSKKLNRTLNQSDFRNNSSHELLNDIDQKFIDRQMFQIIQQKVPNKLAKFMRHRRRIKTQQIMSATTSQLSQQHSIIFKKVYHQQQRKVTKSLQRSKQIKGKFFKKLGLFQPKPISFFDMKRQDIFYIENKCKIQYKQMRKGNTLIHPINQIYQKAATQVYQRRRVPKSVIECKPFNDIQKIQYG